MINKDCRLLACKVEENTSKQNISSLRMCRLWLRTETFWSTVWISRWGFLLATVRHHLLFLDSPKRCNLLRTSTECDFGKSPWLCWSFTSLSIYSSKGERWKNCWIRGRLKSPENSIVKAIFKLRTWWDFPAPFTAIYLNLPRFTKTQN